VSSLLQNPKVHIYVDDGRRWLIAHPEARYDAIICNSTYFWRDHASSLISVEFFELAHKHLNPGGVFYFNTPNPRGHRHRLACFSFRFAVINFLR